MYINPSDHKLYFGVSCMLPEERAIAARIHSVNIKVLGLESDWGTISQNFYTGNDGIFNTYGDFHLIPSTMPFISAKEPLTSYVTVPGSSKGDIDMTTALTGNILYKNREGSLNFMYENHYRMASETHDGAQRSITIGSTTYIATGFQSPFDIFKNIEKYISGRAVIVTLMDDPNIHYKGRIWLDSMTPGEESAGTVTLKYKFEPDPVSINEVQI